MAGPAFVILSPLASLSADCLESGTTPLKLAKADWHCRESKVLKLIQHVYYLQGLAILDWAFGRPLDHTGDDVPLWNEWALPPDDP